MNMHVQIELFGGPEDGREITLPVGAEGSPLSPLPVPSPDSSTESATGESQHVAWYQRDHRKGRGLWVYKYTNSHSVQPENHVSG
ncbi:hypothetical protein JOF55_002490 [Haloactinomyces albus]|uniref:Uncharacterized protein n=2 Tax=Haloactinomyces albus TaxID=1352928 RepID=A0AAE3ZFZ1_9ACTN|nr:hypothetical protein [Haloactinomyces albus]